MFDCTADGPAPCSLAEFQRRLSADGDLEEVNYSTAELTATAYAKIVDLVNRDQRAARIKVLANTARTSGYASGEFGVPELIKVAAKVKKSAWVTSLSEVQKWEAAKNVASFLAAGTDSD